MRVLRHADPVATRADIRIGSRIRIPIHARARGSRTRALRGALAILLGLGLAQVCGGPARAASRPADGGAQRSRYTFGLSYAAVPASTILCAKVAAKAGFSFHSTVETDLGGEPQIVVAIAVAMAESSCDPGATNFTSSGSEDRGLWQLNSRYHPEVSDVCAFQIQCNADAAWNISGHGTDWSPWSAFASGAWKTYRADAQAAISGGFTFLLGSAGGGTCLDAKRGDKSEDGTVRQWTCDSSDPYQRWTVVSGAGAQPILRNAGTGLCLDGGGTQSGDAQPVSQRSCDAADAGQQFAFLGSGRLNTDGEAQALMQNSRDGLCLAADGSHHSDGAPIVQRTCSGSDSFQMWN